jgi:hypothetical protein
LSEIKRAIDERMIEMADTTMSDAIQHIMLQAMTESYEYDLFSIAMQSLTEELSQQVLASEV